VYVLIEEAADARKGVVRLVGLLMVDDDDFC
jgi:hypothetical protein